MPIAEIINEIDAYLCCLGQARDLLLAPMTEVQRKRAPHRKRAVMIEKTARAASSEPRVQGIRSRSTSLASQQKTLKPVRVDIVSPASSSVARQAAKPERLQIEVAEPTIQRAVAPLQTISTGVPSRPKQVRSIRSVRRNAPKPTVRTKVEVVKPAIALAGSMTSKIVVVSAEQARRERDRSAAQPEVRRPRVPATGLSGRLAFEALFSDAGDPSKSSGQ
jgi:hypothetical protein